MSHHICQLQNHNFMFSLKQDINMQKDTLADTVAHNQILIKLPKIIQKCNCSLKKGLIN